MIGKRAKRRDKDTEFNNFPEFEKLAHEAEEMLNWIEKELAAETSERRRELLLSVRQKAKTYADTMAGDTDSIMLSMYDREMISEEQYHDYLKIKAESEKFEKQEKEDSLYG